MNVQDVVVCPPAPFAADEAGEVFTGLDVAMPNGQATLEELVLGSAELALAGSHTMVFSSWAVPYACLDVQFAEGGAKKK